MADRYDLPLVNSVLHPTDFSKASQQAFAHALAIALIRKTSLTILHAGGNRSKSWDSFPSVRTTLERWGMLEAGSPRSAVFDELAVRVKKVISKEKNPLAACLGYLEDHAIDLIVLATGGRQGLRRWLKGSAAENIAQRSETMTLFVPDGGRGFVSAGSGRLTLSRILVPIAHTPSPQPAVQFAARMARVAGGDVGVTLLHVGDAANVPEVHIPEDSAVEWTSEVRQGEAPDEIVAEADRSSANLIVMTTDGRDVLIDALRGSHTERVIRRGPCPVLAVPASWAEEYLSGRSLGDVVSEERRRETKVLKKTFRQAAQSLHPDRASDEDDRAHLTDLMARANRAYEKGDRVEIERIRRERERG